MEKDYGEKEHEKRIDWDKPIEKDPVEFGSLKKKADNLIGEEKYEEAIVYLDRILALLPENEEILANKGFVLCLLGDFDEGLNALKKAFKLNPASRYVMIMAADAYLRYGRPDNSIKLLEKGIDLYPDDDGLVMLKEIILMTKFDKKEYMSFN